MRILSLSWSTGSPFGRNHWNFAGGWASTTFHDDHDDDDDDFHDIDDDHDDHDDDDDDFHDIDADHDDHGDDRDDDDDQYRLKPHHLAGSEVALLSKKLLVQSRLHKPIHRLIKVKIMIWY